jgi:phosphoglycolate phosphatase
MGHPRFTDVRAILFDLDGTLVESNIDFAEMKRRVLALAQSYGVDASPWAAWPTLEIIQRVIAALERRASDDAADFASFANQTIIAVEMDAATRAAPFAGVPEMLRALGAQGFAVGIVTRNCRAAVQRTLAQAPLWSRVLLTRDDVAHVKPDPRHLSAALDAMGMTGQRALMCGDHPMDIAAGRAVGAFTVGIACHAVAHDAMVQARPDLLLERVTDLPRFLAAGKCTA